MRKIESSGKTARATPIEIPRGGEVASERFFDDQRRVYRKTAARVTRIRHAEPHKKIDPFPIPVVPSREMPCPQSWQGQKHAESLHEASTLPHQACRPNWTSCFPPQNCLPAGCGPCR